MLKLLQYITRKKAPVPNFKKRRWLPKSWNEVSIKEFLELDKILSRYKQDRNFVRKDVKVLALFTGDTEIHIQRTFEVGQLAKQIHQMPFLSTEIQRHFPERFKLEGKLYQCHANIAEGHAWQSIMISQYMEAGVEKHMHYICACLIWEPTEKNPGETVEQRAKLFYDSLPISVANGLAAFFLNNSQGLLNATQHYLERKQMKMANLKQTGSSKDGGGWRLLKRYSRKA